MARKLSEKRRKRSEEAAGATSMGGSTGGYYALNGISHPRFEIQQGENIVDVIPYVIKNKNHPHILRDDNDLGEIEANLDINVHPRIGEDKVYFVCPEKAGLRPKCFLCETMWEHWREAGGKSSSDTHPRYKAFQALKDSRRWFLFVRPRTGPQKGMICFWDAPYSGKKAAWGEQVDNKIKFKKKKGITIDYVSTDMDGCSISFDASKGENDNWFEYQEFEFVDRETPVTDDDVDSLPDLSEFMVICSNEEMKAYYLDGKLPDAYKNKKGTSAEETTAETSEETTAETSEDSTESAGAPPALRAPREDKPDPEPETQTASVPESAPAEEPAKDKPEDVPVTSSDSGECPEGREFGPGYRGCTNKKTCPNVDACYKAKRAAK